MKKPSLILIVLSLTLLFIISCSNSTSPNKEGRIEGRVVDANGNPVVDARIMLSYNLEDIQDRPGTPIIYEVPEDRDLKVWLTYHNSSDTVKVVYDGEQVSGGSITWDGSNSNGLKVVNTFYDFHVLATDSKDYKSGKLLTNIDYQSANSSGIDSYESFATTDSKGNYSFDISNLPFSYPDNEIDIYNESGQVIDTQKVSREVNIWVLHADYNYAYQADVYINEDLTKVNDLVLD